MKIAFIGDIVGRPGRKIVKDRLQSFKDLYNIDFVVANGENASAGFGMTIKNCNELINSGIDIFTGGNHSFDKKGDITALFKTQKVLRPDNYPAGVEGSGIKIVEIDNEKLAIINLMGQYGMPNVENPFNWAEQVVSNLQKEGVKNIFIDFHAEATSEKRTLFMMLKGKVSALCGTHTHVGTDDLQIVDDTFYVSDVGLTGCYDNVIGMDEKMPIHRAKTGLGGHFEVPNSCKAIFQFIVLELKNGKCIDAFKVKSYCSKSEANITKAFLF